MDTGLVHYIIDFHPHLLTREEGLALRHFHAEIKLGDDEDSFRRELFVKRGLLTQEAGVLQLLEQGYEPFCQGVGERIMRESPERVLINRCAQCGALARTPRARQCRACGYQWHDQVLGKFKWNSCFELNARSFFLVGELIKGRALKGNRVDLSELGIVSFPKIRIIEPVMLRKGGRVYEEVGLALSDLSAAERDQLKKQSFFHQPIDLLQSDLKSD